MLLSFLISILTVHAIISEDTTFPIKIRFKKEESSEPSTFKKLKDLTLSIPISIGTPRNNIRLNLYNKLYYTYIAGQNSTKISGIKGLESSSAQISESSRDRFGEVRDEFSEAYAAVDKADYGEQSVKSRKITNQELVFLYATYFDDSKTTLKSNSGRLGLSATSANIEFENDFNFFTSLVGYNLISHRIFSFEYVGEEEGYLTIGRLPYEYDSSVSRSSYSASPLYKDPVDSKINRWSFAINEVYFGNKKPENRNFIIKNAYINFNEGMFQGPLSMRNLIYDSFFKKYISNNYCRESFIDGAYFYDCQKEGVKFDTLPKLIFVNDLSNNVFEFTYHDLFYESGGRKYFLIRFIDIEETTDHWILGEPFFKKYETYFDLDNQEIIFKKTGLGRPTEAIISEGKKSSKVGLVIGILVAIIFILAIVFFIRSKRQKNNYSKAENSGGKYDFIIH